MMGTILDALAKEDKVEVTFPNSYRLMQESIRAEVAMDVVNHSVPHKYTHEVTTGKPENTNLKANVRCKDSGNVDEIADAIHKEFEEHISGARRDEHVDGDAEKAVSRDTKLTY